MPSCAPYQSQTQGTLRLSFPTKFTTAIAVDTWDAHFRWRVGDDLRDRTIDATWRRVASAIAGVEGNDAGKWEQCFVETLRDWRIVPDARLLKWAGTGATGIKLDNPRATLNLGAFVVRRQASSPHFDYAAFSDAAALAVRFLDDAWLTYGSKFSAPSICVGVMGFADALAALGWPYISEHASEFASTLGETLSVACSKSSLQLMRERGYCRLLAGTEECKDARSACQKSCGVLRHPRTTAIQAQHLIALFANNASDALDPLSGSAWDLASRLELPVRVDPLDTQQILMQQIKVRECFQPWIDAPIDYPLVYSGDCPKPEVVLACKRFAGQHHLPEPRFRKSEKTILNLA